MEINNKGELKVTKEETENSFNCETNTGRTFIQDVEQLETIRHGHNSLRYDVDSAKYIVKTESHGDYSINSLCEALILLLRQ